MTSWPVTPWPETVTLEGHGIRLERLSQAHASDLAEACQDGDLHRLWYTSVPGPAGVEAEIERRLSLRQAGSMLPFAVVATAPGDTPILLAKRPGENVGKMKCNLVIEIAPVELANERMIRTMLLENREIDLPR